MSGTAYSVETTDRAIIVSGTFSTEDLQTMVKIGREHGFDFIDGLLARRYHATLFLTSREHSAALRKEAGL